MPFTGEMDRVGHLGRRPSPTGISLVHSQEKEKDKNLSLKKVVELSVPPGIHYYLLILFSPLELYFDNTPFWEGKGLLGEKKPSSNPVFPLPQGCFSLHNKQPVDNFSSNAQIDSVSQAEFSNNFSRNRLPYA